MRRRRPTVFPVLLLVTLLAPACKGSADLATAAAETPGRQFIFEGVRLEERRDGKLLWTATAKRADGDLASTDATDIRMVHYSNETNAADYNIVSPRGALDLDNRKARFTDVRILDLAGGLVTAGNADYDGKSEQIAVEGPLEFSVRGLTAHALRAQIKLSDRTMAIEGPVQGTFNPQGAPSPRPPASPKP